MMQGVSINFYIGESGLMSAQTGSAADASGGIVSGIAFEPTLEPPEAVEPALAGEIDLPFSTAQMEELANPAAPDTSITPSGFLPEMAPDQSPLDPATLHEIAAAAEQTAEVLPLEPPELDASDLPLAEGSLTGIEPPRDPEEMGATAAATDEPFRAPVEPEAWGGPMDAESSMPIDPAELEALSLAGLSGPEDLLEPMEPAEIEARASSETYPDDAPPPDLVPEEKGDRPPREATGKTTGRRSRTARTKKSD